MTSLTDQFAVIVVGSLHYDIMLEAPDRPRKGETLIGTKWYPKFGGKGGNQAIAVAKSGSVTRFVGAVGDDDFASFMLDGLKATNISTEYIETVRSSGTGMSVAIMDKEGDYGAVVVSGANLCIDPKMFDESMLWDNAKVLMLQNEVPETTNLAAAKKAKQMGVLVCLNAAPMRPISDELAGLIDILVVNAIEAEDMCGLAVNSLEDAIKASHALYEDGSTIIVTAGGDGLAVKSDKVDFSLPALPVNVISTHGAGDVFVGTLCSNIASGSDLTDAVFEANEAAAKHVSAA